MLGDASIVGSSLTEVMTLVVAFWSYFALGLLPSSMNIDDVSGGVCLLSILSLLHSALILCLVLIILINYGTRALLNVDFVFVLCYF